MRSSRRYAIPYVFCRSILLRMTLRTRLHWMMPGAWLVTEIWSVRGLPLAPELTTGMVGITSTATTSTASRHINSSLVEVRITGYAFGFVFNPAKTDGRGNAPNTIQFGDIRATMRQQ